MKRMCLYFLFAILFGLHNINIFAKTLEGSISIIECKTTVDEDFNLVAHITIENNSPKAISHLEFRFAINSKYHFGSGMTEYATCYVKVPCSAYETTSVTVHPRFHIDEYKESFLDFDNIKCGLTKVRFTDGSFRTQ